MSITITIKAALMDLRVTARTAKKTEERKTEIETSF
tara:strand:- start:345 stop:452 length:108 start_codon:yes stop_codon:yes gene_type:complete